MNKKTGLTLKDWEKLQRTKNVDKMMAALKKYGMSKELYYFLAHDFLAWQANASRPA